MCDAVPLTTMKLFQVLSLYNNLQLYVSSANSMFPIVGLTVIINLALSLKFIRGESVDVPVLRQEATLPVHLPILGMGTAGLRGNTESIVCDGLYRGMRLIDTAQAVEWYDEAAVGRALASCSASSGPEASSDPVIIVTKVHPRSFSRDALRESVSVSIERLQRIDVLLLHSPYCWRGHCTREHEEHSWQQAWGYLEELRDEGVVRAIGVSNFDVPLLEELLALANRKVAVIQNWCCHDLFFAFLCLTHHF